jgi:hypothetical protein
MVIVSAIAFFASPKEDSQCELLQSPTANQRRLMGELHNMVEIINQDENSTSILMPCNAVLGDELGNVYEMKGPYELVCEPEKNSPIRIRSNCGINRNAASIVSSI